MPQLGWCTVIPGARRQASFTAGPGAVGAARHFVRALLDGDARAGDAELVVSELATNALRHGRSPFSVTVTLGRQLRIEVSDASEGLPTPQAASLDAVDGRGLQIVGAVTSAWGTELDPGGGKVVWAELRALPTGRPGTASVADRLRAFSAFVDAEAARLELDDLLGTLLERVTELLDADTATLLLLDERSGLLRARAACAFEEAVLQGVSVPVGLGFAGRVAAELRPVVLDRVDATTVVNPLLWEKGIRSMLGVPLRSARDLLGVLHVGSLSGRRFNEHDVALLELVGVQVAAAI